MDHENHVSLECECLTPTMQGGSRKKIEEKLWGIAAKCRELRKKKCGHQYPTFLQGDIDLPAIHHSFRNNLLQILYESQKKAYTSWFIVPRGPFNSFAHFFPLKCSNALRNALCFARLWKLHYHSTMGAVRFNGWGGKCWLAGFPGGGEIPCTLRGLCCVAPKF